MGPRDTVYRLATSPMDYRRCHALAGEPLTLSWPTVLAERGGKLLGFLSTNPMKQAVVAGPLVTNGHPTPGWIALRLAEAYEVVLRKAGVRFYYFSVTAEKTRWLAILERLSMTPYTVDSGLSWYQRRLE